MLAGLIIVGLATAESERVRAGRRMINVVRMRISEEGRGALTQPP